MQRGVNMKQAEANQEQRDPQGNPNSRGTSKILSMFNSTKSKPTPQEEVAVQSENAASAVEAADSALLALSPLTLSPRHSSSRSWGPVVDSPRRFSWSSQPIAENKNPQSSADSSKKGMNRVN
jgi:hypothetical protein